MRIVAIAIVSVFITFATIIFGFIIGKGFEYFLGPLVSLVGIIIACNIKYPVFKKGAGWKKLFGGLELPVALFMAILRILILVWDHDTPGGLIASELFVAIVFGGAYQYDAWNASNKKNDASKPENI